MLRPDNGDPRIEWQTAGMFFLLVRRRRIDRRRKPRQLSIVVAYEPRARACSWQCMALEGEPDSHAHKHIGDFLTPRAAMEAAERFALEWLAHAGELEQCPCGEIEAPTDPSTDREAQPGGWGRKPPVKAAPNPRSKQSNASQRPSRVARIAR